MTHKEFYIWLEGFMTNRTWADFKQIDVETIQEKMKGVNEVNQPNIFDPNRTPLPINPFPFKDDPYRPPHEVYCGDKTQLND